MARRRAEHVIPHLIFYALGTTTTAALPTQAWTRTPSTSLQPPAPLPWQQHHHHQQQPPPPARRPRHFQRSRSCRASCTRF